jgi:hypothetical protein
MSCNSAPLARAAPFFQGEATMIELFSAITIVKQFCDCKEVPFHWFRNEPATGRSYPDLIQNYQPGDLYPESYVDELFTWDEANGLKEYLDRDYGDAGITTIRQAVLPVPRSTMGLGARRLAVATTSTCSTKQRTTRCRSACGATSIWSAAN